MVTGRFGDLSSHRQRYLVELRSSWLPAGITTLALAGLHALFDRGKELTGTPACLTHVPLTFGINAVAAYVLHRGCVPDRGMATDARSVSLGQTR